MIEVIKAGQNNLKNISIKIKKNTFTVICGPSGSGKSSLAFETLYAEGQRLYIDSLPNYTKQFFKKALKPKVENIFNIPPTIALEQKNNVQNSRSSVASISGVSANLQSLFTQLGTAHCPTHKQALASYSSDSACEFIINNLDKKMGVYILIPLLEDIKNISKLKSSLTSDALTRLCQLNKNKTQIESSFKVEKLTKKQSKNLYIIMDRVSLNEDRVQLKSRLRDSIQSAYHYFIKYNSSSVFSQCLIFNNKGEVSGVSKKSVGDKGEADGVGKKSVGDKKIFSSLKLTENLTCSKCDYQISQIQKHFFNPQSSVGACPDCSGFGHILKIDEKKIIPNSQLSIYEGAIAPLNMPSAVRDFRKLKKFCEKEKINIHTNWKDLKTSEQKLIWEGSKNFFGIKGLFKYLETKKYKMHVRIFLSRYKSPFLCKTCNGGALKIDYLNIFIQKHSISDILNLSVKEALNFITQLQVKQNSAKLKNSQQSRQGKIIIKKLKSELKYLNNLGLSYLHLNRLAKTLSGGEFQRLNLAKQISTQLSDSLYILDEPTIGLHPSDTDKIIFALKKLKEQGNTVLVVEHDPEVIFNSSNIIEMGPKSGIYGGEIIFSGSTKDFLKSSSPTANALINTPKIYTKPRDLQKVKKLKLTGCCGHNLKNVNLEIPLKLFTCVTGVSGSGKSSLIAQTLFPALAAKLKQDFKSSLEHKNLLNYESIESVYFINQKPVSGTQRSNCLSYLKIYDIVRKLLASTKKAQLLKLTSSHFSLNVNAGRCESCEGLGFITVDMLFMDELKITCEECKGKKFKPEILSVKFQGYNILEILNMSVAEALKLFSTYPKITKALGFLQTVGLDYISLGQNSKNLSGGENQRLKIAKELQSSLGANNCYILDEPSTGLHFYEINLLIKVIQKLVDAGNTVIVIEHNLEIIKNADYVVDIGPEAGSNGGELIFQNSVKQLLKTKNSLTAKHLKKYINKQ
ncbi:MAG: excinuclease ABC subunit UvrA [Bdellovibrionales bacterium]|nr:excinuclease ABC subunit UvrA [Bdellovibrionales bacterium]